MSLFTRTILLLSIFVLAVLLAAGIILLTDPSPTPIDRFVAARNLNRAIAYQTVAIEGGRVAKTGSGSLYESSHAVPAEARPGSEVKPMESQIGDAALFYAVEVAAMDELLANLNSGASGINALKQQIAAETRRRREAMQNLVRIGDEFRAYAIQMDSYREAIGGSIGVVFDLDAVVHAGMDDLRSIRAEELQIQVDEGRTIEAIRALEEQNYQISRAFQSTAEKIGMYEKIDPTLSNSAAEVGKPWLRGSVVRASEDRMAGLVWINIGKEDGVTEGQRLAVYRGDRFVAHMRVQSVNPGESLARLEEAFRVGGERILPDDQVRVSTNFATRG